MTPTPWPWLPPWGELLAGGVLVTLLLLAGFAVGVLAGLGWREAEEIGHEKHKKPQK